MSIRIFGPVAWAMFTLSCPDGMSYSEWMDLKRQQRTNPNFGKKSQKKIRLNRRRVNGGRRK